MACIYGIAKLAIQNCRLGLGAGNKWKVRAVDPEETGLVGTEWDESSWEEGSCGVCHVRGVKAHLSQPFLRLCKEDLTQCLTT